VFLDEFRNVSVLVIVPPLDFVVVVVAQVAHLEVVCTVMVMALELDGVIFVFDYNIVGIRGAF
jgi:hypothetical protein